MDYVPVPQFYHDRSIFVTGGTGFMGKVLVEKLLRSCPGIRHIYLLMRPKRGSDVSSRLSELTNSPNGSLAPLQEIRLVSAKKDQKVLQLFDRLRRERPADLLKIVPISGDITEPQLGISASDQNVLIREVSVVFHSAATVKFDEALKLSVTINMLGTRRLVELCHRMLGLEALIHVSTAYCNCDRPDVQEIVYPAPYDPQKIIDCVEWMDSDLIDAVTNKLIGDRPNTYTFTKALAEHMLMQEGGNLPIAIVRPSIVISSYREPVPGWVDNWNGPTGLIAASGKGFFRTMYGDVNAVADFVPVDVVINLMIVTAWRTANDRKDGSRRDLKVYNCVSGIQNPITWGQFVDSCIHYWRLHPTNGGLWYPGGSMKNSRLYHQAASLVYHHIPSYIFDAIAFLSGKKPYMRIVANKLEKAVSCLEYFCKQQWRFHDNNVRQLNMELAEEDLKTFVFDVKKINWQSFLEQYVLGIRNFIFKEDRTSSEKAKKHARRLLWLSWLSQIVILVALWRYVFSRSLKGGRVTYVLLDCLLRVYRMVPGV